MFKYCPKCGNKLESDSVFCDNCGHKLDAPAGTGTGAPYPQPVQPKKNNKGLIIGIVAAAVVLVAAAIVVVVTVILPMFKPKGDGGGTTEPTAVTERLTEPEPETEPETEPEPETEEPTPAPTERITEAVTQRPTQAPTQKPTEAPVDEPKTSAPKKLPYADSLGSISANEFAWISDAMSGGLQGSFLAQEEFLGKWKAEFIYDGIFELVYLTIDTDGTITVQPYQINYGGAWEDEFHEAPYTFGGKFDINRVFGSGVYGNIDLYQFISSGGKQYGMGELKPNTGNNAKIYLVRP